MTSEIGRICLSSNLRKNSKSYLLLNLCRKVIFFWTYVEKLSSSELMSKKSCYQHFRPFTKNFKKNLLALFSIMFGFVSTVEELSIEQLNAYHSKDKLNNSRQNFRLMSIKKKKDRNEFEMVIKMFCYNDPNISLEQIS